MRWPRWAAGIVFQASDAKRGLPALFKAAFCVKSRGSAILTRSSAAADSTRGYFHFLPPGEWGPVSVCLDPQALDWLRSKGEGRLTRINDTLTNLMEAESRIARGDSAILGSGGGT